MGQARFFASISCIERGAATVAHAETACQADPWHPFAVRSLQALGRLLHTIRTQALPAWNLLFSKLTTASAGSKAL